MELMQIIWLALVILFIIVEAMTVSVVSIWFCAGALASFLIALFFPQAVVVQAVAFILVSIVALLLIRPLTKKLVGSKWVATNADANVGKNAQVVSEVQPGRFGRVKLEGLEWTAKSDYVLPVGVWCRVVAIDGVKLVVIPMGPANESTI